MARTRAQQLGLVGARSPKAMASRTKRSLATLRDRLENLAAPYVDIDNHVVEELEALISHFHEFAQVIDDSAEWLNEEADG